MLVAHFDAYEVGPTGIGYVEAKDTLVIHGSAARTDLAIADRLHGWRVQRGDRLRADEESRLRRLLGPGDAHPQPNRLPRTWPRVGPDDHQKKARAEWIG